MPGAKYTIPQAVDALHKAYGNVTKAAKLLGCSRTALSGRVSRHGTLKKAREQAQRLLLDIAEDSLWELVREKNLGAVCFALKCQGKNRGWIENPAQVPQKLDPNETFNVTVTVRQKVE